jgi:hypothetical protein
VHQKQWLAASSHLHNYGRRNLPCLDYERLLSPRTKKADVAEHPKALDHVGLLFNEPLGIAELLFI